MSTKTCPKCAATMDGGFVLDVTHGGQVQSQWVDGEPRKSFWTGISVRRDEKHPVTTYRCSRCGYLESYAEIA